MRRYGWLLLALLAAPIAAQDSMLSALPNDASIDGTEELYCEDSGNTTASMCKVSDIATLAAASGLIFKTIDAPSGTDPVADSATDTLALSSGASFLTITGNSTTDTVTFDIAGTASKCARFDSGGELVAASGDCASGDTSAGIDTNELAPYGQYDPNNPPASCATCDEFTNDTASLTWSWGNQDSSTLTVDLDSYKILGDTAASEWHARATDSPSSGNTDFTLTAKVQVGAPASLQEGCAIGLIETGTIATPTRLSALSMYENGATDLIEFATATNWPFTGYSAIGSGLGPNLDVYNLIPHYLQIRYVDSTRATTAYYSKNGFDWTVVGSSRTLTADPPYFFVAAMEGMICRFEWVRARTDANKNLAGE